MQKNDESRQYHSSEFSVPLFCIIMMTAGVHCVTVCFAAALTTPRSPVIRLCKGRGFFSFRQFFYAKKCFLHGYFVFLQSNT